MKQLFLYMLFSLMCSGIYAQTFYPVTHTSGTQTIGGVSVTATAITGGSTYGGGWCGAAPYWIGQSGSGANGWEFTFSPAVSTTKFQITATGAGEEISFLLNGSAYNLTMANLGAFPGTCSCPYAPVINSGKLTVSGTTSTNGGEEVTINGNISTIRIMNAVAAAGSVFSVLFTADTVVAINITDSMLCTGDTLRVPYTVNSKFKSNNVFTLQLSDASGSFSSPTTLGTINSDTNGVFTWVVPSTITPGSGYRIRVRGSNPSRTSNDNGFNISIGNTPVAKPIAGNNGPVCSNDTLKLTATTTTTAVTWSWTGPNSFSAGIQNPTINAPVAASNGAYIVTARLYGCIARDTTTAVVHTGSGPTGLLATTNAPLCTGDTLKLFGTANGSGINYTWTGPNSFTSTQQNLVFPAATASLSGNYTLYAGNGNCVSSAIAAVLVKPRPANFTAVYNSPVCAGETIDFTASSSSTGVTWAWTGPNSFNSASATPFIAGASAVHNGDYMVTATLNGCSLKDTVTVNVLPLPAKPVAANNGPVCAGSNLQLTAGNIPGVIYTWAGPNSYSSSVQNPGISNTTTAMSGSYIVTANLNGCTAKDTTVVLVKPLPVQVTASSNSPVCAGDTLKVLSTVSSAGASYAWAGPNSFSAGTQNSFIGSSTIAATGWYKMTVNLNGCTTKDSVYATVNPIPATPSVSYGDPLCAGETLHLNAGAITGAMYTWTGVNNFTSLLQNPARPNMQFSDTGTYSVTATVNGCNSSAGSIKVKINPVPFVVILANPGDSICKGDPAVFTALPNNHGGTPAYLWKVNAQNAGTGAIFNTTTLNDGDVVLCEMTEDTKCSAPYVDESNEIDMTVLPWLAPTVSISANPNHPLNANEFVTFTATATNAGNNPKYQWKRNGQHIVGATGSVWSANTLNDNDSISVEVTSNYRCPQPATASSNRIKVKLTGVGTIHLQHGLALYPNPNTGKFIVEASSFAINNEQVELEVYNTLGQVVYKEKAILQTGKLHREIDLAGEAKGVYLLRLSTDSGTEVARFTLR